MSGKVERAVSRAGVMRAAAAGLAGGAAAAAFGKAGNAEAANGAAVLAGEAVGATSPTAIEVDGSNVAYGFGITDNGLEKAPDGNPAILGHTNGGAFQTGILGYAPSTSDTSQIAVSGIAVAGCGVNAVSETGVGLAAASDSGVGVATATETGTAITCQAFTGTAFSALATGTTGVALDVTGVATFSRSGLVTIPAGAISARVTSVTTTSNSLVLATPQGHQPGIGVAGVITKPSASTFTLYLTKKATAPLPVAWFILG